MGLTAPPNELETVVRSALAEDIGPGDVTTEALVDAGATCSAELVLKEPGVISGLAAAEQVFRALDPSVRFEAFVADGDRIAATRAVVARLEGEARALLTGERTALNLLGRLSGIATLTRQYVDAVEGTDAVILDTRKTAPGLRALEKDAVRHGGAGNHRFGLFDGVLAKDNHLALAGGVRSSIERLRSRAPGLPIAVEAESLAQVKEALAAGADRILLDNMSLPAMAQSVALGGAHTTFEASGGVSLATVRAIAETGVDCISVGALTHSARSLDVSMEVLS